MAFSTLKRLFVGLISFWAIHAFASDHFKFEQSLTPTIPGDSKKVRDDYGITVRVHDDFLFVAAPSAKPDGKQAEGVVYVYQQEKGKWVLTQVLAAGCAADSTGFLDIEFKDNWLFISSGATPIVPVPGSPSKIQDFSGAVQVYRLNRHLEEGSQDWILWQTLDSNFPGLEDLTPSSKRGADPDVPTFEAQQGASFGMRISFDLDNKLLLVGAPYQQGLDSDGKPLINAGAVYAFKMNRHGKFKLLQKIVSPDGFAANDTFGANVCIQGHYALISNAAIYKTPRLHSNGTVYVFHYRHDKWHLIQTLHGEQKAPRAIHSPVLGHIKVGDGFGSSLAMHEHWALIGAGLEARGSDHLSGAAYFFKRKQHDNKFLYEFKQKVHSDDPHTQGTALIHVDLRHDTALISDPGRKGPKGPYQGGILLFERDHDKWKQVNTFYDPNGLPRGFFGFGVDRSKEHIVGGSATFAASYLFRQVGLPTLPKRHPIQRNHVVVFERK